VATWTADDADVAISLANAGVGTIITNDFKHIGTALRNAESDAQEN